jgi:hypothetical protein
MARSARTAEERAKAVTMWAALTLLFFAAGLIFSLRGFGIDVAPPVDDASLAPQTVNGVVTYVRVDNGGHAVSCAMSYTSSQCSTVGIVVTRRAQRAK